MKTIYKYPLEVADVQLVDMPAHAELLTVQIQRGVPCLWAVVDTAEPLRKIRVLTFGTGMPVPEDEKLRWIGTYQLDKGSLVFHVFACE